MRAVLFLGQHANISHHVVFSFVRGSRNDWGLLQKETRNTTAPNANTNADRDGEAKTGC